MTNVYIQKQCQIRLYFFVIFLYVCYQLQSSIFVFSLFCSFLQQEPKKKEKKMVKFDDNLDQIKFNWVTCFWTLFEIMELFSKCLHRIIPKKIITFASRNDIQLIKSVTCFLKCSYSLLVCIACMLEIISNIWRMLYNNNYE